MLHNTQSPPDYLIPRIGSYLKVMAEMDIAEKRLPQDGRIVFQNPQKPIECRINTLPTLWGEKICLRFINNEYTRLTLDNLGFEKEQQRLFLDILNKPQGMILVTGPTGSGKTATLYSALKELNTENRNISSAEDPIEQSINGINQVAINSNIGLNFSNTLRAFLRQDPDVLMVGEIRDTETADIAIKASQTGHLVLSTLHTNSAKETISRLLNLKVSPFNLSTSLSLIISQRLIRLLCSHCKQFQRLSITDDHLYLDELGQLIDDEKPLELWQANDKGCKHCHQGYRGRTAIYELLTIDQHQSEQLLKPPHQIQPMDSLLDSGLKKALQGITSLGEIRRILG